MKPAIVILGNLSDGFTFVGPFPSWEDAVASKYAKQPGSWIVTLDTP